MEKYRVTCGFATGQENFHTNKWFSQEFVGKGKPEQIVRKCLDIGYKLSDDICADWVFSIFDEVKGEYLAVSEVQNAEKLAYKILLDRM